MKRILSNGLCLLLLSLLLVTGAWAANTGLQVTDVFSYGDASQPGSVITVSEIDGEHYLFMPSYADPAEFSLNFSLSQAGANCTVSGALASQSAVSGEIVDLTALCGEGDSYQLTLQAAAWGQSVSYTLNVCYSASVAAVYLTSTDPVNEGRAWVESSADKSNKATGTMLMVNAEGETVYNDALTQIKGRGNSTWWVEKKPYQIKLDKKTDLLESGDSDNKNKTWVLLANYYDPTVVRNILTYNLAEAMGMAASIESRFVDLYYDGEYRGTYQLSEKVSISAGRVDITELEELNEDANPDTDLEDLTVAAGTTGNGATYTYCVGMNDPADITGGYLLEQDTKDRALEEVCYFRTTRGNYVVVKSPEYCSQAEMDYIASLYQEFEDTLFSGGTNPNNGKALADYVDLTSLAQVYLLNEFSKNMDGFRTSSYLYKETGSGFLYMGPAWDYDLAYGAPSDYSNKDPEGWYTMMNNTDFGEQLFESEAFRAAVSDIFTNTMLPLLQNVVLGDIDAVSEDGSLHSLSYYYALVERSQVQNNLLWPSLQDGASLAENQETLRNFITKRTAWLAENLPKWIAEADAGLMHQYYDVDADAWYAEDVAKVTELGYMQGMGDGSFCPEEMLTRAQIIQVLYNIASDKSYVQTESPFSDVSLSQWYTKAVLWGYQHGVILGFDDGTYRPDAQVTRQDAILMIYRFLSAEAAEGNLAEAFSDSGDISGYAYNAVEWAVENDILRGYRADNTLKPRKNITRAEFAAVILRAMGKE